MKDKKSFILYTDLIHTVSKMPSDKAGDLFKHILKYVNDEEPVTDDLIIELTFEPIKQQLKRDLNKWSESKVSQSKNGDLGNLKRWNIDLYEKVESNELTLDEAKKIANDRKVSPPDNTRSGKVANVAVSVNDNVNVIDKNNKKENPIYKELSFKFYENLKALNMISKNQNPESKTWTNQFKGLIEKDGVTVEQVKNALNFYFERYEDDYCPVIKSPKAFREKFEKLRDHKKRYDARTNN